MNKKIVILSDNELWSKDFALAFEEIGRRDLLEIVEFDGENMPKVPELEEVALVYARASPSALARGKPLANEYMLESVKGFESKGVRVVNGSKAIEIELDKAKQFEMLKKAGILIPRTVFVSNCRSIDQILGIVRSFDDSFFIKPNIGGSGAGIEYFGSFEDLEQKLEQGSLEGSFLGKDLIVQEKIVSEDELNPSIYRFEYVGGDLYYVVKVNVREGVYNNCAADACQEGLCGIDQVVEEKFTIVDIEDFPYDENIKSFLKEVGSEIAGIEFVKSNDGWYCIDPNVANTNYGRKQEVRYNELNGTELSGHRRVAEYLCSLLVDS